MKSNMLAPKNKHSNAAQAMVEFAIVLPILLLLLYGLLEVGRLLFMYSSIVTASRQASRYGSATGQAGNFSVEGGPNNSGVLRYQDCDGIRWAAHRADYLKAVDYAGAGVVIKYDTGSGTTVSSICSVGTHTQSWTPAADNTTRMVVTVTGVFHPLVPLIPWDNKTITATSARTILRSVTIAPLGAGGGSATGVQITSHTPNPSVPGQDVTVHVSVTGGTGTPTGQINIIGADVNCTITLPDTSCVIRFNTGGMKTIQADYLGDTTHNASTDTEPHQVTSPTTIAINSHEPNPSLPGWSVPISVTVAGINPTGTVSITSTEGASCTITLVAANNGIGACNLVFNTMGTYTISVQYSGDANNKPSGPVTTTHDVKDPILRITADTPDPSRVSEPVAVTVVVASSLGTPTNNVDVRANDGATCTITLSGGTGTCNLVFNSVGLKTITASYGNPTVLASDTEEHRVHAPTSTTITAHTPSSSVPGGSVAVTVTVAGSSTTPTGKVTIGGADTPCTITLSGGTGTCSIVFNTVGTKMITASYSGDDSHAGSQDPDGQTHLVINPLVVTTTANPTAPLSPPAMAVGNTIIYNYTLKNEGSATLTGLTLADTKFGSIPTCTGTISAGATKTCSYSYSVQQADIDAGSFTSQAAASAAYGGNSVTGMGNAIQIITYSDARLQLAITANPPSYTSAGENIGFTYRLTNTGGKSLSVPANAITGQLGTAPSCPAGTLAQGDHVDCTGGLYTIQPADVATGVTSITNSATATVLDGGSSISDTATKVVPRQYACSTPQVVLTANADTYVSEQNPKKNYGYGGAADPLQIRSALGGNQRILVNFNFTDTPTPMGCVISSATLSLYAYELPSSSRSLVAGEASASWGETTVTWETGISMLATPAPVTITSGTSEGTRSWDVTAIIQEWYGTNTYNGFIIQDTNENAFSSYLHRFRNQNASTAIQRPQLTIIYSQVP